MADDYSINAKITADTSGYEKGIKKVQKTTQEFSKGIAGVVEKLGKNGLVQSIASVGLAVNSLTSSFRIVTDVIKKVGKAVGECTEAYKTQLIAERQLDTAIQNNPFMTGASSEALKNFASELQRVSNYGDEQLIPLMANLASLGRTQEEIMQIMKTATDMASSGAVSLDTAINQLNMTLNGNIGRLGMQNKELKGLTEEELKNGKAVEILGQKYKGLAEATVDTSQQLKNIKGDFKEAIGEFTLPSSDMWNKFWIGFYEKGISVINKFNDYLNKTIIGSNISEKLVEGVKQITDARQQELYLEDNIHELSEEQLKSLNDYLSGLKKKTKEQEKVLNVVQMETEARIFLAKLYAQMDAEEAERNKKKAEEEENEDKIAKLKEKYTEEIKKQEDTWEKQKNITGKQVELTEKLKFYEDKLVAIMVEAGGQITTNNQYYKDQMAIINQIREELAGQSGELADLSSWNDKLLQQELDRLEIKKSEAEETNNYKEQKNYIDEIMLLKLEQLHKQEQIDLQSVEDTANAEEARKKIIEYYDNERVLIFSEANGQIAEMQKKQIEEQEKAQKDAITKIANYAKEYADKIGSFFEKMGRAISSTFNKVKSTMKKLFAFNVDDALDNLLVFEDSVLTFFVETLPKLPSFLASALQSIGVLLQSVLQSGGFAQLGEIIASMFAQVIEYVPVIAEIFEQIIEKVFGKVDIKKFISMLGTFIGNLAKKLPSLIRKVFPVITKSIMELIKMLPQIVPQMLGGIIDTITTLLNQILTSLPQILQTLIPSVIETIVKSLPMFIEGLGKVVAGILKALPDIIFAIINGLVDFINNLTADDMVNIVTAIIKAIWEIGKALVASIPKILQGFWELAKGLIKGLWNLLLEALKATWKGLKWVLDLVVDGFKKLFGYETGTNNARAGYALVGEAGPELVKFKGGEQVLNTRNTQKALAGAGGNSNTFNVTFNNLQDTSAYAMMSQLKAYNRQMAINGII